MSAMVENEPDTRPFAEGDKQLASLAQELGEAAQIFAEATRTVRWQRAESAKAEEQLAAARRAYEHAHRAYALQLGSQGFLETFAPPDGIEDGR